MSAFIILLSVFLLIQNKCTAAESSCPYHRSEDGPASVQESDNSESISEDGREDEETPRGDMVKMDRSSPMGNFGTPSIPLYGGWPYECEAKKPVRCNPKQKYRTFDGSCNNHKHPTWGLYQSCYDRLFPPDYADGRSAMRVGKDGKPLPNTRIISLILSNPKGPFVPDQRMNQLMMQFGQFLIHDFTISLAFVKVNCCDIGARNNPECFPVQLPKNDPFYAGYGQRCHHFIRQEVCEFPCRKGVRETPNQMTAYIDASMIYGPEEKLAKSIRGPDGTLLAQNSPTAGELMPASFFPMNDSCSIPQKNLLCFQGGDPFVDEQTASTAVFTLFFRQHNRLARGLKALNPKWNGDRIYQETRRILIAQFQMITYWEYIPLVLGRKRTKEFKLRVMTKGGYTKYQPETNPGVIHGFAHAAMRFGHSQVQSFFSLPPTADGVTGRFLRDMFLLPFGIYHGEFDRFIRGMTVDPSDQVDTQIGFDMQNFLYRDRVNITGEDIYIRDIMRGRDHGMPGYLHYLRFCNGPTIKDFEDLVQVMPRDKAEKFAKLYKNVEDIDLFPAALAEYHYPGGIVGPTFSCLLGLQFYHFKYGDRFYFEHEDQVGSFTPDQLEEIRRTLLSKLICELTNIYEIQKYALLLPSKENPLMKCSDIPDMDLTPWRETKTNRY